MENTEGLLTPPEEYIYTSSDPTVAQVVDAGIVVPLSDGTAEITVSLPRDDIVLTMRVEIEHNNDCLVWMRKDTLELKVGDTADNYISVLSWSAVIGQVQVEWYSSNPQVARVTGDRENITLLKPGICTVTALAPGSSTVTAVCYNVDKDHGRTLLASASFQVEVMGETPPPDGEETDPPQNEAEPGARPEGAEGSPDPDTEPTP